MTVAKVALGACVVLALMTVLVDAKTRWFELEGYTFDSYREEYPKEYSDGSELEMRRQIFEGNLKKIRQHNADGRSMYKMGVNHLTDRTPEELKRMNGGRSRQMTNSPTKPQATHAWKSAMSTPLPTTVDWRMQAPSVLTGVKDQGLCGSCYAHAAVETIESYKAIATGELFTLSQEEATACVGNPDSCGGTGGCNGNIAEAVYQYAMDHGLSQEWNVPYTSYMGTTGTCRNTSLSYVWLEGWTKLPANNQTAVMEALAMYGPLAVNVDASSWSFYEAGIFDGCSYAKNISIDHVVQLVGYGHDDALQADYWLVRNSWAPVFGENGYIKVFKNSTAPSCGWDVDPMDGTACRGSPNQLWVCGECGILWDTSFPIVRRRPGPPSRSVKKH